MKGTAHAPHAPHARCFWLTLPAHVVQIIGPTNKPSEGFEMIVSKSRWSAILPSSVVLRIAGAYCTSLSASRTACATVTGVATSFYRKSQHTC